jgi:hypothetical protein
VKYKRLSDVVRGQINGLHKAALGGPLFIKNDDHPGQNTPSTTTLRMAELALVALGNLNARKVKEAMH